MMEGISTKQNKAYGIKKAPYYLNTGLYAVWTGLEPAASCVTGRHSNQLNYQTFF